MARDYGSKRTTRARNNAPQQILVVIVSFLLGYLAACILDVGTISHWLNNQVLAHEEAKPQPTKPEPQQAKQLPPKPKFEFYTLLANEKRAPQPLITTPATNAAAVTNHHVASPAAPVHVATSTAGASVAAAAHPVAVKPTPQSPAMVKVAEGKPLSTTTSQASKGAYLVQVASFKAQTDAEHMKALLTLKGLSVSVVPINTPNQGIWYRVIIGPYPTRDLAQKAQLMLAKTERLNGMVRSVGG